MRAGSTFLLAAVIAIFHTVAPAGVSTPGSSTASRQDWMKRAPWSDPSFFPVAVWLQSPANAARYRAIGINCYVGLWRGPTEEQLNLLKQAEMRVICSQNETALKFRDDPLLIGWMHGDEPDNAQSLGEGRGWGPPIPPEKIVADYQQLRNTDPSRPVLLNLGQGVAWDSWHGRGVRSNHPEDYPRYLRGCDIASFDIYPVVHDRPQVAGKLWMVADGVKRLVEWTDGKQPVWNCIECTHISNPDKKATPAQVRSMVWMSLIHGSRGIIYFVHQFKPSFREAALLDDSEMLAAVTKINRQIADLASVLNRPSLTNAISVVSSDEAVPIAALAKSTEKFTYVFASAMRDGNATATFRLAPGQKATRVRVIDEARTIPIRDGSFEDRFASWDVHLYQIEP